MFCSPFFFLSLNQPARENEGDILMGTIGWTGNFRFTFEVDNLNGLRIISGINPPCFRILSETQNRIQYTGIYFSLTVLRVPVKPPEFPPTGPGNTRLKDGLADRMTLLNNWEATYFDFNEDKLIDLFGEAQKLGVDMFLLDDGWFAKNIP